MTARTATPPASVLALATAYVNAGLSIIPIGLDGRKQPAFAVLPRIEDPDHPDKTKSTWEPYKSRLANRDELRNWFGSKTPYAMAVIGGAVSGGAECIDLDDKETASAFLGMVAEEAPDLFSRLSLEDTPRGVHVWYRCEEIAGNQKLATRSDGKNDKGHPKVKALIETRGEGGYAVVAGSPLTAHELRLPYKHSGGPTLTELADITAGERDYLFRTAMSFDREDRSHTSPAKPVERGAELSPIDDYDVRGPTFSDLLSDAVFQCPGKDEGNITRPGKERGTSATVGRCRGSRGEPLLKVFTSNWHPFESGKVYGRFQVLRLTRFNGDGQEATRWLASQGFGSQTKRTAPKPKPSAEPVEVDEVQAQPEAWEDPIPLDDPADSPVPFPLKCLPEPLAKLCADIGETIGCPPDYSACFALATMSGTAGASVAVNVKEDWEEHASLFICAVAPPNGGKTPSFKLITRPVIEEQTKRISEGDKHPAYVGDVTVEKLAEILRDGPRGALLLRDELAGWIKGMDQYKAKGGSDRQFWLSAWSSDSVSVHRKNPDSPHVFIAHPCISVAGGIQPDVLGSLRGNDDGFYDRILFTYPQTLQAKGEDWKSCEKGLLKAWSCALTKIRGVGMVADGTKPLRPRFVSLEEEAKGEWVRYTNVLAKKINDPDFPKHLTGVAGKLKGYGARLALVSMLLRVAYAKNGEIGSLTKEDMKNGAAIAMYFLAHAERVYRVMGRDPGVNDATKVLRWVRANGKPTFSRRDAYRGLRKSFSKPELLAEPLRRLVQHGYLRYSGGGSPLAAGSGRRSAIYEVNPSLEPGDKGDKGDNRPLSR